MNWLQESFSNIPTIDDRIPWLLFTIQQQQQQQKQQQQHDIPVVVVLSSEWFQFLHGEWKIYSPNFMIWNILILLLLLQTIYQVIVAIIIYYGIIQRRNTILSYIIGYIIIIPITLYIPFILINTLVIDNTIVRLACSTSSVMIFFRCIEAMYNTSPPVVESTISTYCIYYTSIMHYDWNPITKQRTTLSLIELQKNSLNIIQYYFLLSLLTSFMIHTNFTPFSGSNVIYTNYHLHTVYDLLSFNHISNAYITAVLLYCTFSFGFSLAAFGDEIKGMVRTKQIFCNPLFTSISPSDFWSRKWNLMIHRVLKYGIFLPARQYFQCTISVSIVITYIFSGLLHEYTNTILFYHRQQLRNPVSGICDTCYVYTPGKLVSFFLYNGIIMLLEKPFAKIIFFLMNKISSSYDNHDKNKTKTLLPLPIHSTLVILTALPVAHWYYGDFIAGQYFHHLSIGLWKITKS